jgi:acetyltransferase-like isoleucine patch superfamily enzyme
MLKSIFLKIIKKTARVLKPLLRIAAEEADLVLFYPRLAIGQHPLVFKDNENILKNNIPKSVYFNTRSGKITVGSNTVFGEYVMVLTGKHNFISDIKSEEELHQVPEDGRDIEIGDNCYIGSGAIIIGPVRIGDFAVIGAGAVVTKDVISGTLVVGIPAAKIKDLKSK